MSETIKDQETASEQGNAGRRRLVRGAVALAPLVLTLRSGALAAASCTAARVVTLDNQAQIPNGSASDVSCINEQYPPVCAGSPLTGDTRVTTQTYTLVSVQKTPIGSSGKFNYYCGDPNQPTIGAGRQVAILSSSGNTSILNSR